MSDILEEVKRTPIPFKQKLTLGLLGLVILCSGIGLGVSLTINHLKDTGRLRPPNASPPMFMDRLERVTKEYSLTPDQKEQVKPILETYHESFKQMFCKIMG